MSATMDQAEKGMLSMPEKRGTGFSIFGSRKQPFLWHNNLRAPAWSGTTPMVRPGERKRTASSNSILPPTPSSTPLTLESPESQITLLCLAVTVGDEKTASSMMDRLENVDMLRSTGFTAQDASGNGLLQISALHGHSHILEELLKRAININAVDRNHGTALQAAIYMGQKAICRQLLDWERPKPRNLEYREDFLKDKINVNTKGGYFGCALQVAAYKGDEDLVRELLGSKHQADVNISGGKYGSSLQAAVRTGRMTVVGQLLPNSNVNVKGGKYGSALQAVARGAYRTMMSLPVISRGNPLKHSAQISHGSFVYREDGDTNYIEVANALLRYGARLDGGSGILDNPINAAACSGSSEMLDLMLRNFGKRSTEWKESMSMVLTKALLTAITRSPENQEILARFLVENGASIQYATSEVLPNLPLEAAATKGLLGVVKFLLEVKDTAGQYADTLAESGIHGTALRAAIAASKSDKEDVAEYLVIRIAEQWGLKERSASGTGNVKTIMPAEVVEHPSTIHDPITRKTDDNDLDWTRWDADYGNLVQLATVSGLRNTVSLLLEYGADPNVRDTSRRTALHIAAWFGFPQIVRLLLAKEADISAKDEWGATPLDQAEEALDRNGHPGATQQDLQDIVQTLRGKMGEVDSENPGKEFRGPKRILTVSKKPPRGAKPVFAMPFWIPGLGFRATIIDIWESHKQEYLLLKKPRIEEILYHRSILDSIMLCKEKPRNVTNKLRWIHIPTNNMTWAEMIINGILKDKNVAYKTLWGADPFYTSPDLSPHARFITPQCGRLVPDGFSAREAQTEGAEQQPTPLFMAMPYIHWEAYIAQMNVSNMIDELKEELLKANANVNDKIPLWPSERVVITPGLQITDTSGHTTAQAEAKAPELDHLGLDHPEAEEDYFELLRRYLYKRRPVHLRRTLDQYYYSHLADTNGRDSDQVVMRDFNEDKKRLRLETDPKYKALLDKKRELEGDQIKPRYPANQQFPKTADPSAPIPTVTPWERVIKKFEAPSRRTKLKDVEGKLEKVYQQNYYDENSPVLMIDQLWLWVIDENTIVTCFPHRQYDRNAEDLDATDKTDILKTIVSYLHSSRRAEINNADALAELIIKQCVGILHKADMIPRLDFLKKYSVQSNKWADQAMQMLSQFVEDFEDFMTWIKEQPAESEQSIRWFESIFSVTEQTRLLRNLQDLKDELGMLKAVFDDQIHVLTAASQQIELVECKYGCVFDAAVVQRNARCPHSSAALADQSAKHLRHVERMQFQANQAYDTLKDLLNLKQQQAYVLEARVSRNEAISSGVQSKTIMVFTIVTIIFLPLTFITTIFTLPIAEFQRVVMPTGADFPPTPFMRKSYVLKYILGITFAVAVPLILAALEIQSVFNGWKKLRLKLAKSRRQKGLEERKPEDDGMPDFLKPKQWN